MYTISRFDPTRGQEVYFKETDLKLRDLALIIKEKFHASKILVFGSYARRSVHEMSDIDLIVVGEFSKRFHHRISEVRDLTDLPIEPLCYTPEEFEDMFSRNNGLILNALEEGFEL